MKSMFQLREDITFLNFGSFGACPKPIFQTYQAFQKELEEDPVHFIVRKAPEYLYQSRTALSNYLNCAADDVVCVTNPSYAVNIIAKSLPLAQGDEVLATNIEYGACDRVWKYYCEQKGAKYIRQAIKFPLQTKEDFIEQFTAGITEKTKLIFISHITSATAIRLPVEEICKIAKEKGILTFVDGAHAPAQVSLDITEMDVDIYTGACHKWMMAPKGSSFLYVRKSLQHLFDPLVISWGYESDMPSHSQFIDYHEMQGTRDLSAFCAIPSAVQFMQNYDWDKVSVACKKLVQDNALRFCSLFQTTPITMINDDFIGQMFSIPIQTKNPERLHDLLYDTYKIQVPVMQQNGQWYVRYSIQAFNTQEDLDVLYNALSEVVH